MPRHPAILGTARLGNFRLGYRPAALTALRATRSRILLDGVPARGLVSGLTVHDVINDAPDTCVITFDGTETPVDAQRLRISIGSDTPRRLFTGALQDVTLSYVGDPPHLLYPCTAIDDAWQANRRQPFGMWTTVSATTIGQYLAGVAGLSPAGIALGLPNVSINLDSSEGISGAFAQLAKLIGGYFNLEDGVAYLFQTDATDAPDAIDDTPGRFLDDPKITMTTDASQLLTRAYGKGGGAAAATAIAVGQTTLPVEDVAFFEAGGGLVVAPGTQRISYTGISSGSSVAQGGSTTVQGGSTTVVARPAPSAAPVLSEYASIEAAPGYWSAAYSFVYSDGRESPLSPLPAPFLLDNGFSLLVSSIQVGTAYGIAGRRVYVDLIWSGAPSTTPSYPYHTDGLVADNTNTSYANPLGTAGAGAPPSTQGYASGAGYVFVADTAKFLAGGGSARVGAQVFTYTGRSTSSGVGALTGVSGITASIAVGATIDAVIPIGATVVPVTDTTPFVSAGGTATAGGQTIAYTGRSTTSGAGNVTGVTGIAAPIVGGSAIVSATLAGSTTLPIVDTAAFSAVGGTARVAATTFTYTGRSTASGPGTLTGIPASGAGALTVTVLGGTTVLVGAGGAGSLIGVPASGAGSVQYAINQGAPINIWIQRDDLAAQAEQAALDLAKGRSPADGIYEGPPLVDERRGSASLTALLDATLALYSRPIRTVVHACRDLKARSGKLQHYDVTTPRIGPFDLTIQEVTITEIDVAPGLAPKFVVTASSVAGKTLDGLMRQLLAASA